MNGTVITICSLKHKDVWRLTSEALIRFVTASEYIVYVPEVERSEFERITGKAITIRSQEDLSVEFGENLSMKVSQAQNTERHGWYLQQFLKIEALLRCENERAVIWDADCVPLKEIKLFDSEGKVRYMSASEFNPHYFDLIYKILGLPRTHNHSFVIPGFPVYTTWIKEFADFLSGRYQMMPWHSVLMDNVDFRLRSGFSETETMGTWIVSRYSEMCSTSEYNWERSGQSKFGYARNFSLDKLISRAHEANEVDIVTFENWDLRGVKLFVNKLRAKLWG